MNARTIDWLVVTALIFILACGIAAAELLGLRTVQAKPPPQQPILHGKDGRFRCQREADAWLQLSTARGESTTPNDVDVWLNAWRDRGGDCK